MRRHSSWTLLGLGILLSGVVAVTAGVHGARADHHSKWQTAPTHRPRPTASPLAPEGTTTTAAPTATRNTTPSGGATEGTIRFGAVVPHMERGNLNDLEEFERTVNKRVSIALNYYSWNMSSMNGGWRLDTGFLEAVRNHGSIPMIAWYSMEDKSSNQSAYQLKNIYNGQYDNYIHQWALDAKNWGHPFFLRFNSEMNGDWTPWCDCSNANNKGDYVKAWRHVHDIFTQVGAMNVAWVWAVNIEFEGMHSIDYLYPGDNYVDWVGMNGYNMGTAFPDTAWQSFHQVFYPTYRDLQTLTSKPIMIGEMGSAEKGGDKASWISDTLNTQLVANFSKVKAFIWFELNKETDWRINSSATALGAFRQGIQNPAYLQNAFGDIVSIAS